MKSISSIQTVLLCVLFGACKPPAGTISPDNATANLAVPDDFRDRVFAKNSAGYRDNLAELVGTITIIQAGNTISPAGIPRPLIPNAKIITQFVPEGTLYYSKVTDKFALATGLKYIVEVGTKLDETSMAEIVIEDILVTRVEEASIDWIKIRDAATSVQANPGEKRCFVQSARLARIGWRKFTKIDNENSLRVGDIFSFGQTYWSSTSTHKNEYKLSFECIDLDVVRRSLDTQNFALDSGNEPIIRYLETSISNDSVDAEWRIHGRDLSELEIVLP